MKKSGNKKGFTLAELLIVMAIISILIAIAIPVFSAQLERARVTVDRSNARAASSLAYSEYMLYHTDSDGTAGEAITYTFGTDESGNLFILAHSNAEGEAFEDNKGTGEELAAKSATLGTAKLTVVIEDCKVTENSWLAALDE